CCRRWQASNRDGSLSIPTSRFSAPGAAMPACAERTTSAMNSRPPRVSPELQPSLFGVEPEPEVGLPQPEAVDVKQAPREGRPPRDGDEAARQFAVDPRNNVVLEASA